MRQYCIKNEFFIIYECMYSSIITQVLEALAEKGIAIRMASPKLVMEVAPESYKNVTEVVDTWHAAGISRIYVKLRPIGIIKG